MNAETETDKSYELPEIDEAAASDIVASCGLMPLTARVLVARGIKTPADADRFLTPSLERDWHDPACIPGLLEVADKVEAALRADKRILVFGDFDVDGITATTIGVRGLRALGGDAVGLIPHRYTEGYALSEKAVERAMGYEPGLIVTVDCGISCGSEVSWMLEQGIDVAITDHHEPGEKVPQDVPVADPKCDADCPSRDLAGAGVALKLIEVLGERFGKPDLWRDYTDFATLGTVADLMPLQGENRALVADGIRRINNSPRTCFLALAAICNVKPGDIDSTRLSFSFIPRLNAAGRMGDATVALELMLSDEREQAERLASALDAVNTARREAESQLEEQVEERLSEDFHGEPVIVAAGEGWHEGVKGIVASRIARAYKRPTIVFSVEDGVARGSGRTYDDANLFELVSSCSDLLEKFGGHTAAVGVTLPADDIPAFRERICEAARKLAAGEAVRGVPLDCEVGLEECDIAGFDELQYLQPFGNSNPIPRLLVRNVFLEHRGACGKQGNHFRYIATDGVSRVSGIFFGVDDIDELVSCESACDIVFDPSVDEWQGRRSAKLMTRDIRPHRAPESAETAVSARVDELLEHAAEIADTGEYAGITQVPRFNTKVVGVTFENRQAALATLEAGVELRLRRQPQNEFDPNAIAVELLDGTPLGFLNRQLASRLAPAMDEGTPYDAAVSEVTGGPASGHEGATGDVRAPGPLGVRDPGVVDRSYGVNIVVRRADLDLEDAEGQAALAVDEGARSAWSKLDAAELDDRLRFALIGDHELHDAQARTLANLAAGRSTLAVMATGRGKSLIFHMHAARMALRESKASVFVYPLRALVADQAYHLQQVFGEFGLSVCVLTGESDTEQRERIFGGLSAGTVDVVLTTPEFLSIHAGKFAQTGRIGFVVVDEAHHVGQSKAGNRPAYAALGQTLAALGDPLVLAVTATAGDAECRVICSTLSIQEVVLDPTVRDNLHIDDRRDLRDRASYLASIVAGGGKCVAYVNSRGQSAELANMLRKRLPELAPRIGFYNAGLTKDDRKRIEAWFREGELVAIVSTSAFGEGIDIPDIEHVVLYHLPFNDIEFNQMSGRAGRDGRDAQVHLLYSYGDARINERILAASAPSRDQMVALYRALKAQAARAAQRGEEWFSCTNLDLSQHACELDRKAGIDESGVSCGIAVFRELGFLETSGRGVSRRIRMADAPPHMDLHDSVRYREGEQESRDFAQFKKWALGASPEELLRRFNRPILPVHPEDLPLG